MREAFLALIGFSFGALSAAGVFTVLAAVGLVPRFVGKTRTAQNVTVYENMIVLGTILLVISFLCDLGDYNWLHAVTLLIMVAGLIVHIVMNKKHLD